MIRTHYTGLLRRTENIIWNAAGRYDFDPPFMAFLENGQPDDYMNNVIGLAVKWFEIDRVAAFFASFGGAAKAEEFDELLWLGLENCLYEKEVAQRPRLAALREKRAREFLARRGTLSTHQMMLQSMLVYDQQEARWRDVTAAAEGAGTENFDTRVSHILPGSEPAERTLSPRERKMRGALLFPGTLDTDDVIRTMEAFLKTFFRYDAKNADRDAAGNGRRAVFPGAAGVLKKLLRHETRMRDSLVVRTGTGTGDAAGSAVLAHDGRVKRNTMPLPEDLAYIEAAFGKCALPEQTLRLYENELCKDEHAYCRLWVAKGGNGRTAAQAGNVMSADDSGETEKIRKAAGEIPALSSADLRDLTRFHTDTAKQHVRNADWYGQRTPLILSSVRKLSARIEEVLSSYEQALPEESRAGMLRPELSWRIPAVRDPAVFTKPGEETERSISVDLLLDASASRLNYQELLAAEAAVIAKSLALCHVPVQVETFRSLRGVTVLQILKERESSDLSHIFDYTAGGWNRDGLGLRLAGRFLPDKNAVSKRLLLVLTDASPNDLAKIPAGENEFTDHEYEGKAAVLDTKKAVAELRDEGILTAAIFLGPTLYMENLHTIYGSSCTRIHRIQQMEEAVAELLEGILRDDRRK